jgi:DNA polymerase
MVAEAPPPGGKGAKATALLEQTLQDIGFRSPYYFTSMVKCRPPEGRKPETDEVKACSYFLDQEMRIGKPKFVLTLGATPTKILAKKAKITESVGQIIERDGVTYVPCFHPSFVLRDPGRIHEFRRTLKRFKEIVEGGEHKEVDLTYKVVGRDTLQEFISDFTECTEFSYDLETTGLDHYNPNSGINCIGFYLNTKKAWVFPILKAPTLPQHVQLSVVNKLVSLSNGKKAIGHNVKFDSLWIRQKYGVNFHSHFDTMLAHYLIDENTPHGLKELSRFYLNAPDYDLTSAEKRGNCAADKLFKYNAWDCI